MARCLVLELHQFEIAGDDADAGEIGRPDDVPHRHAPFVVADRAVERGIFGNVELGLVAEHRRQGRLRIEVDRKHAQAAQRQAL